MIKFWKIWRARKAAVSTILPLVDRTRFANGEIADSRWLDAYMIGFLTMLITRIATDRIHSIGPESLGIVQAEAWQEITGLPGELMGEEACLLSAGNHADFCMGCQNADHLVRALAVEKNNLLHSSAHPFRHQAEANSDMVIHDRDILALWSDYFEKPLLQVT